MSGQPPTPVAALCAELQRLQRERAVVMKSRIMQANRLQAVVAGTLGYSAGMTEKDRRRKFTEAAALIKAVAAGTAEPAFAQVIRCSLVGISGPGGFLDYQAALECSMTMLARRLPVHAWARGPLRRGFGELNLAIVVGECGDLGGYANPGKLWRRMGCAPWSFGGKTAMGSTWRGGKEGKLPAEEWGNYGYSPRRRSIAYLIGEGLVKQNFLRNGGAGDSCSDTATGLAGSAEAGGDGAGESSGETESGAARPGPYRLRYDEAKARAKEAHPDWTPQRCHRHAMLLCTKRLLRDLWLAWRQ